MKTNYTKLAKTIVHDYILKMLKPQNDFEILTVWSCKTIQNYKWILISDIEWDNRIYEVTYNGDKKEFYLDGYDRFEHKVIKNVTKED